MSTILSKQEVELLLADYAFGSLSEEDILHFEQSITHYPNLQIELEHIQSSFKKVESIDYYAVADQRTRNLSLRVQERLEAKKTQRFQFDIRYFYRTILPVAGITILALLYITIRPLSNQTTAVLSNNQTNHLEIIRPIDTQVIINDEISIAMVLEESNKLIANPEIMPEASNTLDELMAGTLQNWNGTATTNTRNDDLWLNFTDTELQDIFKDLNYENPTIL